VNVTYRPTSTWPGPRTPVSGRGRSPFRASWQTTVDELKREAAFLGAGDVVVEVALEERHIRVDGLPRANAPQPADPGVVLSFPRTLHGPLRYSCDAFTRWQDNLRAIVLGLESLRRVERYGIAKRGEQYAGWKQLPASTVTREEARRRLEVLLRDEPIEAHLLSDKSLARRAVRRAHPDVGGDATVWRDEIEPAYRRLVAT
jgi:hypothetical protein